MCPNPESMPRRALLRRAGRLAGLAVVAALGGTGAPAAGKAAKSDMFYQDHGRDGKQCRQCKFFVSGGDGASAGRCTIVDGPISPEGWCAGFVAKPAAGSAILGAG